jgi:hypothetical protein
MKPKLLYDVLRQTSPRKNFSHTNRYNVLRGASPADSVRSNASIRSRSQSIKRKNPGEDNNGVSYATVTSGTVPSGSDTTIDVEEVTENIVKVKSICEKVSTELGNTNIDPGLIPVFSLINEAILGLCTTQEKIVNQKITGTGTSSAPPPSQHSQGESNDQKRARRDSSEFNFVDLRTLSQRNSRPEKRTPPSETDPQVKKFKEAVKEAEKSTVIFNLNLGRVPIINPDTMNTRVTRALTEKAAKKDGINGTIPKDDTVAILDDVLSIAKSVKFFGKTTKTYKNPRDPLSGSYCTVPVRYEFPDKDSRIHAETVFKEQCKVQCSTPYPLILRETMKQVLDQTKSAHPNHFVKVTVDANNMCLRVVKRPMLAEGDTSKKVWSTVSDNFPIPALCLDLGLRKVPDDFKVNFLSADPDPDLDMDSESELESTLTPNSDRSKGNKSPQRRGSHNDKKK